MFEVRRLPGEQSMRLVFLARLCGCAAILGASAMVGTGRAAPASPPDEVKEIAGLDVAIWKPAGVGPHPLVLFSHGLKGCKTQSSRLMRALAEAGMLVAAPDHADHRMEDQCETEPPVDPQDPDLLKLLNPENWSATLNKNRRTDIENLRSALQESGSGVSELIDFDRMALVGHSLGGYTVLGLAGAWPGWEMGEIKAVVALAPFAHPFSRGGALSSIRIPVLYQFGTEDRAVRTVALNALGIFAALAKPACTMEYQGADHFAWTDLRSQFQDATAAAMVAFLDEALDGDEDPPMATILASPQAPAPVCR